MLKFSRNNEFIGEYDIRELETLISNGTIKTDDKIFIEKSNTWASLDSIPSFSKLINFDPPKALENEFNDNTSSLCEVKNYYNDLMKCNACENEISYLSEICPNCGSPNTWIHPKIAHFLRIKDTIVIKEKFKFGMSKIEINGNLNRDVPVWLWIIAVIMSLPIFQTDAGILWAIFFFATTCISLMLFAGYIYSIFDNSKWFKANLAKNEWESSDDIFWYPVRKALDL